MNNRIDCCPICNNQGTIIYTNAINSRIHLLTIGNHGRYLSRICNNCLSRIDDHFATGIFPKLHGIGFEVLVFGLPIYFYEIYEQYPKLKEYLYRALRFVNNIYKGFVKIPPDVKHIYDFATLIKLIDEENLMVEKEEILEFLRVKHPCIVNNIHEKSKEILNWCVKMKFPITLYY